MTNDRESFSDKELWFLFSQNPPAAVIGLPDPTLGYLTAEKVSLRARLQKSLEASGFTKPGARGGVAILRPLAEQIKIIGQPHHTVLAVRSDASGHQLMHSLHFAAGKIVGLYSEPGGRYSILPVQDPHEIVDFLMQPLLTAIYLQHDDDALILPQKQLERARSLIEKRQLARARELLQDYSVSPERFKRLARAYRDPITSFSLITFLHRNRPGSTITRGFAGAATEDNLWVFHPLSGSSSSIEVRSVGKDELEALITELLPVQEVVA